MRKLFEDLSWQNLRANARDMGVASYALIAGMIAMFVIVVVISVESWNASAGTDVPPVGYAAMMAGVVFSLVVGVGLMALVFYSSRTGYDEPAKLIAPKRDDDSRKGTSL